MDEPYSKKAKTVQNEVKFNNLNLFLNEETADVKFLFDASETSEAKEIPAHKLIIAMNSVVFRQMFFGALRETENVRITDASADAFIEFLQFFYLAEVTLTGKNVSEIMYLANKYDVPHCMTECDNFLKETFDTEAMCWLYETAVYHERKDVIKHIEETFQINPKCIFNAPDFKSSPRDILKRILVMNLRCFELEVFKACVEWAKEACKQVNVDESDTENWKTQLGDCFRLIRFPSMLYQEFSATLENDRNLFDVDTLADLVVHIGLKCPLQVATQFNKIRRWNILTCPRNSGSVSCYHHTIQQLEVMNFSTNKRILLELIIVNDMIHPLIKIELLGNIKIFVIDQESMTNDLLHNQPVTISNVSNVYGLSKPIIMESNRQYEKI